VVGPMKLMTREYSRPIVAAVAVRSEEQEKKWKEDVFF